MPVSKSTDTGATDENQCTSQVAQDVAHKSVNTQWSIIPRSGKSVYLLLDEMGATQDRELFTESMAERLKVRGIEFCKNNCENQANEARWLAMVQELQRHDFVSIP